MIDWLGLRCPFKNADFHDLKSLGLKRLQSSIDADGDEFDLRHPWESIPSDFSGMAFKVFDADTSRKESTAFVEIKASPAKLLQGHNVFGSDDFMSCCIVLLKTLCMAYPDLIEHLDNDNWELFEIDITYFSRADSQTDTTQFIHCLQNVSKGQTRSRNGYDGTAYFGSNKSRLKKIKAYDKYKELLAFMSSKQYKENREKLAAIYTPELLAFAECMIRWEVRLKSRWFERRGFESLNIKKFKTQFNPVECWKEAIADILESLEGQKMQAIDDENIHNELKARFQVISEKTGKVSFSAANAAYMMFRAIKKEGYAKVKLLYPSRTFYRYVSMIKQCGISDAYLQNQLGDGTSNVIPLVRFAVVEFGKQYPDWYKPETTPLRLVA